MSDRTEERMRPHRWPGNPSDGNPDVLAWRCAACGAWVWEFGPTVTDDCPVDWRAAVTGSSAGGEQ